jgi:hypothetical protein
MTPNPAIQALGLDQNHPRIAAILAQHPTPCPTVELRDDIELALDTMNLEDTLESRILSGAQTLDATHIIWDIIRHVRWFTVEYAHPSEWLVKQTPTHAEEPEEGWLEVASLLAIAGVQIRRLRQAGIEERHITFNLNHLTNYINGYANAHQKLGTGNFTWCIYLASIGLIHLHTLHFMHHVMNDPLVMARHKEEGDVVMLALGGVRVRRDGQIDGVNGIHDLAFETTFTETDATIQGHRVNPYGAITNDVVTLSKDEYDVVLRQGDPTIDFHIPTGPGYNIQDMKKSFLEAVEVFSAMNPTIDYRAFWCASWLYSPQLPLLLSKQTGHIATIYDQSYVFPATAGEGSLFEFVFHDKHAKPMDITPKTSLERDIVGFYEQGGRINAGTFLYLFADLDRFGSSPYRTDALKQEFLAMQSND